MSSTLADRTPVVVSAKPSSFEEELRELLRSRLRFLFVVGVLVAIAAHFFYISLKGLDPEIETPFVAWQTWIYDLYLVAVVIGALLIFIRNWSMPALLIIDYSVVTFCILLSFFISVVFDRNQIPIFAMSILLLVHAAFVPVPVRYQVGLALTAALGFSLVAALGWAYVPGIRDYWVANEGAAQFRAPLWEGTFQIAVLGAISVVFTKLLYHMRMRLHEAQRLGSYVIERELGRGGMGMVYVAQHALMCRPSAVKVMQAVPGEGDLSLIRFEREVRLSATLSHPNTITVYDFGRTGQETFYYAMEYLVGMNLEELVRRFGPVTPERTVFILSQVCGSLGEAHANEIIHRDIKPSNIFLTHRGGLFDFVKVLDFGLAKRVAPDPSSDITTAGAVMGTPAFISPEAASGMQRVGARADIYGLGCVAYWLLAGRPPFEAASSVQMIVKHVQASPTRVADISEVPLPDELDAIVMRCMEKDPSQRFATAVELEAALRAVPVERPWTHERAQDWWTMHCPELAGADEAAGLDFAGAGDDALK